MELAPPPLRSWDEYLEERHPDPPFYPRDVADRARARWLEEYADTRMGDVFIWRLFNQVAINPCVWGKPTDRDTVNKPIMRPKATPNAVPMTQP